MTTICDRCKFGVVFLPKVQLKQSQMATGSTIDAAHNFICLNPNIAAGVSVGRYTQATRSCYTHEY